MNDFALALHLFGSPFKYLMIQSTPHTHKEVTNKKAGFEGRLF